MRNFTQLIVLLLFGSLMLHATTTTDKARLKPKPGNVVVVFRGDSTDENKGISDAPNSTPSSNPQNNNGDANNNGYPTQEFISSDIRSNNMGAANVYSNMNITAYPNPTTDILFVEVPSNGNNTNVVISLYTLSGQEILTNNTSDLRTNLNVQDLASGLYLVVVKNGIETWSQKISIIH